MNHNKVLHQYLKNTIFSFIFKRLIHLCCWDRVISQMNVFKWNIITRVFCQRILLTIRLLVTKTRGTGSIYQLCVILCFDILLIIKTMCCCRTSTPSLSMFSNKSATWNLIQSSVTFKKEIPKFLSIWYYLLLVFKNMFTNIG